MTGAEGPRAAADGADRKADLVLVLGGARSGKSAVAEDWAARWSARLGLPVLYLATGQAVDAEMAERIRRHQERRPAGWRTVEEPLQVAEWLKARRDGAVVLLDCLSMLLNNWMWLEHCGDDALTERIARLADALAKVPGPVVAVSQEAGLGIVPADAQTRRYRDCLGLLNQAVARRAGRVLWVVAGIPVDLRRLAVSADDALAEAMEAGGAARWPAARSADAKVRSEEGTT
ncbi:MAG: bifunctional adenosylcobinamide kinase/adenosylcobinamide-phosphate guanylyltransferase [Alicyclobacillus macrosporangiidus]|uniref:bifunctional adenosylcobinamide kinase/adenosylcobinamide-phosphate guanylyltransferase n=1 Tax=Alicyclobacillus macrosporangiidus TaxID=392015 RepID=UPI0026EC805F|nr:bifunctional adenosylcobinamide kinase/adenosylcobinamide-phosphate guanylyltransferase [Alicyclobacillus macrosporangiidus]MCL6600377.1 bifunctional adenosylcobinamide kinase/adenosylcobinamide-phosphate guanylyltransferase [Alicyclobacillus macrosporangiidus]